MMTMNALIQLSVIAIAIVSVVSASPVDGGKCAMYGNCSPVPGKLAPCAHSAPAEKPNFDMSVCSMYQNLACCDADSYKIVSSNIAQLTVLFQRCPACLMNLEALFCGIFCSPNQADFVSGIQVNSSTGSPFVQSANVAIASEFGNGMFDSCLDVQFGATGLTVFSAVFGNPSNASELYNFLFVNPTSPTISALVVENTDQGGLDDTAAIQCNSTNPNYRCSVVDCPACAAQYQMKFLVGVNSTQTSCASTGRTVFLKANTSKGDSPSVSVGDCDQGPLTYTVSSSSSGEVTVTVVFYSSNIEDASPPSCSFAWTGDYLPPPPSAQPGDSPSLLPGCSVADSREGYHMTYYWFYLLDWNTQ